ncbi:Starch-binding associating with outer membrane [Daejeonella rubra]|uniref:Starch-binding associating with outer membrane n=1 Tax=Daejeonella rubra TaxID=990371 RepID=A0A1G9PYI1_9SPHI|nr:RagB/SusD family nutrient uptake outer membrane protein [Daejeonella rubra]SDM03820.1 Starch-binding associating with outer membrane [Daejeonella rubra]
MKKYILIFLLCPLLFVAGCKKDLLEKLPLDRLTDEDYWTSESNVRTFSWNFYPRYFPGYASGFDLTWGGFFTGESLNDDVASTSRFTQNLPTSNGTWSGSFSWIRRANLFIEKVKTVPMPDEAKKHWTGIARYFRAMEYSNRVNDFGDFPWYNKVLDETDPALYKPRDPRALVMDSVLADFQYAAANVRVNDGDKAIINRYAVLATMSRVFLFEGTWQKYHVGNNAKATQYLEAAKWAANEVIVSGKFTVAADYRGMFSAPDLASNPEVILYRRYETGLLTHSLASYVNKEAQTGYTKDAVDSYLAKDGLPIGLSPLYLGDKTIYSAGGVKKSAAMANRDPRINETFADSLRITGYVKDYAYSTSGYAVVKFLDESVRDKAEGLSSTNTSDAPEIRYGEVLMNYAEAAAELGTLTQADLDKTVNKLRARADIKMPNLQVVGILPAVNGVVYNDPNRDPAVPSLIWEIRRERRVELMMEGFRYDDLRRWKKLDYVDQVKNKNANRGAWIKRSDYPKATTVMIEGNAAEGYIIPIQSAASYRLFDNARVYLSPVGPDQIKLYKDQGVELTQNPGW